MKRHAKVTPALRRWIVQQIEASQSPEALLQQLVAKGWPEGTALDLLERTLRTRVAQMSALGRIEKKSSTD
jgi:hypothetical protein